MDIVTVSPLPFSINPLISFFGCLVHPLCYATLAYPAPSLPKRVLTMYILSSFFNQDSSEELFSTQLWLLTAGWQWHNLTNHRPFLELFQLNWKGSGLFILSKMFFMFACQTLYKIWYCHMQPKALIMYHFFHNLGCSLLYMYIFFNWVSLKSVN